MSAQPLPREILDADAYLWGERRAAERREYCNGPTDAIELASIGCRIQFGDVYAKVEMGG